MAREKRNPFAGEVMSEVIRDEDNWPDGFEVVVQEITWGKQQKINQKLTPKGIKLPEDKAAAEAMRAQMTLDMMNTPDYRMEILKAGVQSWSFVDGDGKPVPLNDKAFDKLPGSWGDFIMEGIERLNPDRDADFRGDDGSVTGT